MVLYCGTSSLGELIFCSFLMYLKMKQMSNMIVYCLWYVLISFFIFFFLVLHAVLFKLRVSSLRKYFVESISILAFFLR